MKPFLYLVIISALVIAGTAALFSVTGIATLFSGHFVQVVIMAGGLEAGKIVLASLLYRYWKSLAWFHKTYMTLALLVLMLITSMGIFGYLSESYQKIRGNYTITEKQIEGLNSRKDRFEINIKDYQEEKNQLDDQINNLILALQTNRIEYIDEKGNKVVMQSSIARKLYQQQLEDAQNRKQLLTEKIDIFSDSVMTIDSRTIELESQNISGELGPLKYVADVFETDMDTTVKWLILILIFVFDPLAISLIVAANMIYMKQSDKKNIEENAEFTEHFTDKFKKIFNKNKKIEISDDIKNINISKPIDEDMAKSVKKGIDIIKEQPISGSNEEIKKKNYPEPKWHSSNWKPPV